MLFFRKRRQDDRVRLEEMMRLRGAVLTDPLSEADAHDLALATQRCLQCRRKDLCDERLAAGNSTGYGLFCPNTHYIERLRGSSLRFS